MSLDTTIPARFLTSAYRDDDLIVIAYRCLASRPRPSSRPRRSDDLTANGIAATVDDAPQVAKTANRPIWHHRFVTAATASSSRYLAWLRHLNAAGNDIFVSMNTFVSREGRRTERNVSTIRHIYVDFDRGGNLALRGLLARNDLPPPSHIIHSSVGKFQVVWNVTDFDPPYAKRLLGHLASELGADLAATDLNRVFRLPGFYNFKYSPPQFVRLEVGADLGPHGPGAFPVPPESPHVALRMPRQRATGLPGTTTALSQSERDWAAVRSALSAGDSWTNVWQELITSRPDKANPQYYASRTVLNALTSLALPHPPELVRALNASRQVRR